MSAWEATQTRPVKEIVAEVFEQMDGRSDSDPLSPWAGLSLALCERVTTAESDLAALRAAVRELAGEMDRVVGVWTLDRRMTMAVVRWRDSLRALLPGGDDRGTGR